MGDMARTGLLSGVGDFAQAYSGKANRALGIYEKAAFVILVLRTLMAKKAVITGITGQDGSFLAEFLLAKG